MIAGLLGHYGAAMTPELNEKSKQANLLVDEYNETVCNLPDEEQMAYQKEMVDKIHDIWK